MLDFGDLMREVADGGKGGVEAETCAVSATSMPGRVTVYCEGPIVVRD